MVEAVLSQGIQEAESFHEPIFVEVVREPSANLDAESPSLEVQKGGQEVNKAEQAPVNFTDKLMGMTGRVLLSMATKLGAFENQRAREIEKLLEGHQFDNEVDQNEITYHLGKIDDLTGRIEFHQQEIRIGEQRIQGRIDIINPLMAEKERIEQGAGTHE